MLEIGLRGLAMVSVILYFVFGFWDSKRIQDEREELIRLKSFELMHKLTLISVTLAAVVILWNPDIAATYPVMLVVLASMYGEIFGKLFYRRKY